MNNSLTLVDEMNQTEKQTYCSINLDSTENKKKVFKISEKADGVVRDILDKPFMLKDVFIQKYEKVDDSTGEVVTKTRTILIDDKGKSYASASKGLFNSLLKMFALLGMPDTWDEPIEVKIQETPINNGGKTYVVTPVI